MAALTRPHDDRLRPGDRVAHIDGRTGCVRQVDTAGPLPLALVTLERGPLEALPWGYLERVGR